MNEIKWRIKVFKELTPLEVYQMAQKRFEVFAMEQKIICENDFDGLDNQYTHLLGYLGDELVAYCRMNIPEDVDTPITIGRVLVVKEQRGKGLGVKMMRHAIKWIRSNNASRDIELSAQSYIVSLYEKVGFKKISDEYMEAGIPHIHMKYIN